MAKETFRKVGAQERVWNVDGEAMSVKEGGGGSSALQWGNFTLGMVNARSYKNAGSRFCGRHLMRWWVLVLTKPECEISSMGRYAQLLKYYVLFCRWFDHMNRVKFGWSAPWIPWYFSFLIKLSIYHFRLESENSVVGQLESGLLLRHQTDFKSNHLQLQSWWVSQTNHCIWILNSGPLPQQLNNSMEAGFIEQGEK